MKRREFSKRVRFEIVQRATGGTGHLGDLRCEGCGLPRPKKWEVDHVLAEALVVDKSAPLTAKDGQLLGLECCHRKKSASDVGKIRKADRQRDSFLGIKRPKGFYKPPGTRFDWKSGRHVRDAT